MASPAAWAAVPVIVLFTVRDMEFLQQRFKFATSDLDYKPRYNIAPTQDVLTVTNVGDRQALFMRWGLAPFWAKDLKLGTG